MKKLTTSMLTGLVVASSALAGQPMVESKPTVAPLEPCFKDMEFQLDLFGSYTDTQGGGYTDGFGGGVAMNYFFARYIGVGVDGNIFDGGVNGVWDFTGRVIARYPLELSSVCLAPYIFGGGGVETNGVVVGTWHAGGGLEWRATSSVGVFGEGRYTWAEEDHDGAQARLGVRVVF